MPQPGGGLYDPSIPRRNEGCSPGTPATKAPEDAYSAAPFVPDGAAGNTDARVMLVQVRGTVLEEEIHRRPERLVPTVHPSAVLRADDREQAYQGLVADLEVAARALG